jgi:predicted AAA+ superfamily ATPase
MELDTDIEYRKRKIENLIEKYLKIFGAVLIEGPRGCGKSTTGKYLANSYISLQKSAKTIKAIENDISIALVGEVPRLIDE